MPIDSESEVSSNGSSSTVSVTVEESSTNPGGPKRYVDVLLHVEPGRFTPVPPPQPAAYAYSASGINVWWKDLEFTPGQVRKIRLQLAGKIGRRYRGCSNYTVIVTSASPKTIRVHHGCLYNDGARRFLMASADFFKLVPRKLPRRKSSAGSAPKRARGKAAR